MKFNSNPWTQEEDNFLHRIVEEVGRTKWSLVSTRLNQQSLGRPRTPKQCRERWINYANPDINKSSWSEEEKKMIYELYKTLGPKWAVIANHLDGRTENSVKNFFYSDQRKTLRYQKKKIQREFESQNGTEISNSFENTRKNTQDLNHPYFLIQNFNFQNQVIENIGSSFFIPSISFTFNFYTCLYDQNCLGHDTNNNINADFGCCRFPENYSSQNNS